MRIDGSPKRVATEVAGLRVGLALAFAGCTFGVGSPTEALAQGHEAGRSHDELAGHHAGLHFSHPLVAESVSPDTKIRFDHRFFEFPDGDEENSGVLEVEYAFHRGFSVELGLPYSYTESAFGNLEVLLKFANYAFEGSGLLLGYGVEFGFPTNGSPEGDRGEGEVEGSTAVAARFPAAGAGSGPAVGRRDAPPPARSSSGGAGVAGTLGTDEYEVAPFLNLGFQRGGWELIGWLIFEIPFNQAEREEVATELGWNASILYRVSPGFQTLLEFDGSSGISGEAVGENVVNIAPGLKFRPMADRPLFLGLSAGFPLAAEEPFDTRVKASAFWHF